MKRYEIDCFKVTETYDRDVNTIALVSNVHLAMELVDKQSGYRSYSPHTLIITIFDSIDEIELNSKENLIKSARSKLTPAECKALGI